MSLPLDHFEMYECCVQSPRHVVSFLRALHGHEPTALREDFCGSAAVSRRWLEDAHRRNERASAIAIDLDPAALAAARRATPATIADSLTLLQGDCAVKAAPAADTGADLTFVGNFSIGYLHERRALMAYLKQTLKRLRKGSHDMGGGVFVCDLYGGPNAYVLGAVERRHTGPKGEIVHYCWRHVAANPITAMVENSISFRLELNGEVIGEYPDAFTYRWRLWTIAELSEAMLEVGFESTEVHTEVNLPPGVAPVPVQDPTQIKPDWIVLVVGRTSAG